jgi:aminoglycoside phosphotransferase (APT) family kinase protein
MNLSPPSPQEIESHVQSALSAIAPSIEPGAAHIDNLQRLSGGATQEIWSFNVLGPKLRKRKILRRAPGGSSISTVGIGLDVEARLVSAAGAAGTPTPRVDHILTPADNLGSGFIMEFVEGETLGGRIVRSDRFESARQKLAFDCGAILARIHSLDSTQFPTLQHHTPAELVRQWRDIYRAGTVVRPVFELAFRWLAEHAPTSPAKPSLVHGDFRNGNLMIDENGVRAVLDWELAHLGDPMEDLGWMCVNSWRFGQIDKPVGGFGHYDELFAGYEQASGSKLDRSILRWWETLGSIRWGVICAGGLEGFRTTDPSVERALIARRASETEIDLLRLVQD